MRMMKGEVEASNGEDFPSHAHHSHVKPSAIDEDHEDDTEKETEELPDFFWEDDALHAHTLLAMDKMRKNKHFCDVVLQIGKQDIPAHRAVLAAASPYLMELFTSEEGQPSHKEVKGSVLYQLNGGFEREALERLIDYAYTARLDIPSSSVQRVFSAAIRLRMDRAAAQCALFLASNVSLETCLEIRAIQGITRESNAKLLGQVNTFIQGNIEKLATTRAFMGLPHLQIEILHSSREELETTRTDSLAQHVLDWIHSSWLEDGSLSLKALEEKKHLLYMGKDSVVMDCEKIEEGSVNDSDKIQDYKKSNQQSSKQTKVRRKYSSKQGNFRDALLSRHINQDEEKTEDRSEDWTVIASTVIGGSGGSILSLITIDGKLAYCSIIKRLNRPNSPSIEAGSSSSPTVPIAAINAANRAFSGTALGNGNSGTASRKSPSISRPPSLEKDQYVTVANMSEAKCGVGAAALNGQLVVCGGYDRTECVQTVSVLNADDNEWSHLEPMLSKRARFDVTVMNNCIYAVAGSNGTSEQATAEKYDSVEGKWSYIASLPVPVSNIGLTHLDNVVYCIGGTYGQSGNKHCFRLIPDESRWERIASLKQGRSQCGACAFQGEIWVVGGCDAWSPLSSVEVYNPVTNTWRLGPPMGSPRRGCGLVEHQGLLYAVGGLDGTQSLCTTEIYDPRMNLWTAGPNMTTCRANVSATVVGDNLWAVGGFNGKVFLNTVEYLDSSRDEWTTYIRTPGSDDSSPEEPEMPSSPSQELLSPSAEESVSLNGEEVEESKVQEADFPQPESSSKPSAKAPHPKITFQVEPSDGLISPTGEGEESGTAAVSPSSNCGN